VHLKIIGEEKRGSVIFPKASTNSKGEKVERERPGGNQSLLADRPSCPERAWTKEGWRAQLLLRGEEEKRSGA